MWSTKIYNYTKNSPLLSKSGEKPQIKSVHKNNKI